MKALPALGAAALLLAPLSAIAGVPGLPRVSIEAPIAVTAEPGPTIFVIPGQFAVTREGDLSQPLSVFLGYSGSATPGLDYAPLPTLVEFAPGEDTVPFFVFAVDDEELEPPETVVATIHDPTLGPLPLYEIVNATATVVINDTDGLFGDPVVSIEATRPIAEETAEPLRRINLVGEFTVSRTGPTANPLPVWVHASGSATPGDDYAPLPLLVTIPSGESSFSFPVHAFFDTIPEGIETVVATVSNCPPNTIPPMGAPCYGFQIDPLNASDTVFIREDGLSRATVHITRPENGDHFPPGSPILLEAVAIDLDSYISRVEFFAGPDLVGVSELFFFVAPDPGTPIHHQIEWTSPPAGTHVLTARGGFPGTPPVTSSPVTITVGDGPGNQPPTVAITQPTAGTSFPTGSPIQVVVEGTDPDGYIPFVELFANGMKIGEQNIAFLIPPPPGQTQVVTFTWPDPMPGPQVLTARVTDNEGATGDSDPVSIFVDLPPPGPLVTVRARDCFAVEPRSGFPPNTATFRLKRHGPTQGDLPVHYTMSGRATNGVDYQQLSGVAVIPDGTRTVEITVVPLADQLPEGRESVVLRLDSRPTYHLGARRRAFAVISDGPWSHPPDRPHCRSLGDGLVHLCFPAQPGLCFRIEATSNGHDWTTRYCLLPTNGMIHFIEEASPAHPRRCFRIAPEPHGTPGE